MVGTQYRFVRQDEIKLKGYIGRGAFAIVREAEFRGSKVAVRVLQAFAANESLESDETIRNRRKEKMQKEVEVYEHVSHPNVVGYLGANLEEEQPFIVTELSHLGDLNRFLKWHHPPVPVLLWMAEQIIAAMSYLHRHSPPIVHGDLKPENLLVFDEYVVKIADFGISQILEHNRSVITMSGTPGTPHYMAPECFEDAFSHGGAVRVGPKSDVFSLGSVLYWLFTGRRPFEELESKREVPPSLMGFLIGQEIIAARKDNQDYRPPFPAGCGTPQDMKALIRDCWRHNPDERPTMENALERIRDIRSHQASPTSSRPSSQWCPPKAQVLKEHLVHQPQLGPRPFLPAVSGPSGLPNVGEDRQAPPEGETRRSEGQHWPTPFGGEDRPSSSGREEAEEKLSRQLKCQYSALDTKEVAALRRCFERADVEHREYITVDQAYSAVNSTQDGEHGFGLLREHLLSLLSLQRSSQSSQKGAINMNQLLEMACTAKGREGGLSFFNSNQEEALKQQFNRSDTNSWLTPREVESGDLHHLSYPHTSSNSLGTHLPTSLPQPGSGTIHPVLAPHIHSPTSISTLGTDDSTSHLFLTPAQPVITSTLTHIPQVPPPPIALSPPRQSSAYLPCNQQYQQYHEQQQQYQQRQHLQPQQQYQKQQQQYQTHQQQCQWRQYPQQQQQPFHSTTSTSMYIHRGELSFCPPHSLAPAPPHSPALHCQAIQPNNFITTNNSGAVATCLPSPSSLPSPSGLPFPSCLRFNTQIAPPPAALAPAPACTAGVHLHPPEGHVTAPTPLASRSPSWLPSQLPSQLPGQLPNQPLSQLSNQLPSRLPYQLTDLLPDQLAIGMGSGMSIARGDSPGANTPEERNNPAASQPLPQNDTDAVTRTARADAAPTRCRQHQNELLEQQHKQQQHQNELLEQQQQQHSHHARSSVLMNTCKGELDMPPSRLSAFSSGTSQAQDFITTTATVATIHPGTEIAGGIAPALSPATTSRRCDVFISHAGEQKEAASRLARELQTGWSASAKVVTSQMEGTSEARADAAAVVVLLSMQYLEDPRLLDELNLLLARHRTGHVLILPVLCAEDSLPGAAAADAESSFSSFVARAGRYLDEQLAKESIYPQQRDRWSAALEQIARGNFNQFCLPTDASVNCTNATRRQIIELARAQLTRCRRLPYPERCYPEHSQLGRYDASNIRAVKELLEEHEVVLIHGMAGTGKTALARMVFQDLCNSLPSEVTCVWLSIEAKHLKGKNAVVELQQQLLQQLNCFRTPYDSEDGRGLLREMLQDVQVVLVVDNVHIAGFGNVLSFLLPDNIMQVAASRSRLIVTSQHLRVTMACSDLPPAVFEVPPLSAAAGNELLDKFAGFEASSLHKDACKDLFIGCNGLPLAFAAAGQYFAALPPSASASLSALIAAVQSRVNAALQESFIHLREDFQHALLEVVRLSGGRSWEATERQYGRHIMRELLRGSWLMQQQEQQGQQGQQGQRSPVVAMHRAVQTFCKHCHEVHGRLPTPCPPLLHRRQNGDNVGEHYQCGPQHQLAHHQTSYVKQLELGHHPH